MAASGQEKQYYDQLFALVDTDDAGVLPGHDALPFLTSSGLPPQTLGEVWAIADPENNGFLTREGWYKAARVIGWLQKGNKTQVDNSLVSKPGPLPTFKGYPSPPAASQGPLSANVTGSGLPPLTASDRTNFTRIFVSCGPSNGFVNGDKARDVFLKSQLNYDKLGLIWNLADTQQRGALDLTDFIIGMYLIQSCMSNSAINLPTTLPPGTYEAASGGRSAPTSPPPRGPGSPIQRQMTGTLQPQLTGQSLVAAASTPPRSMTASSMTAPFSSDSSSPPWDVKPDAKAASDRFFAQLDTQNKGVIEGDVAVPFMLQSNLDEGTLASIWDLADIRQEGKLTRDEFAVAMYLINAKLAGKDIPTTLPMSLIPPTLRSPSARQAAPAPAPARDLFDLFDDDAAAPTAAAPPLATAFLSQPPTRRGTTDTNTRQVQPFGVPSQPTPQASGDLLGEDSNETPSAVLDKSADLGNKKNQLANTNRSVTELGKARAELEQNAASTATQLATLEAELSTARMKHETETKTVTDLRIRVGEQTAKLKQLQAEVISAESDLTAMRMEKQELEQALLTGKEEVRGLQKRMKEFEDEKTGLKLLLDKIKKEARQQKGMVAIAKKQVSTAEAARDVAQQDVRDAEAEAEAPEKVVPSPSPVRALSPEATGNSRASTNPFDRLNRSASASSDPSSSIPSSNIPAFAAFAGGATAAGALAGGFFAANAEEEKDSHDEERAPPAATAENAEVDPFGMPTATAASGPNDDDPFGAGEPGQPDQSGFADTGFGDSFGTPTAGAPPVAGESSGFDAEFADLENSSEVPTPIEPAVASPPKFAFNPELRPEPERTDSTQAVPPSSVPQTPLESPAAAQGDDSSDEEEGPEDLDGPRRDYSRSMSPAVDKPSSIENAILTPSNASTPSAAPAVATSPSPPSEDVHKTRRSAPPPPVSRSHSQPTTVTPPVVTAATDAEYDPFGAPVAPEDQQSSTVAATPPPTAPATGASTSGDFELDPFGAPISPATSEAKPATSVNPFGAPFAPMAPFATTSSSAFQAPVGSSPLSAVPKTSQFDDEDFDFPDLPKTQETGAPANQMASSAFDDEFANFDDDFDKPASQVQTSSDKSYEVVSAPQAQDEWGMPNTAAAGPSNTLSFDDAFGGDFSTGPADTTFKSTAPPLPERPDLPQPDDLEDVKKLCGMGFPRTLVVEALDANGYSFQKALNVLLDK